MVNKANNIYNRWADGQEVQTVLQHVVNDDLHEPDAVALAAGFAPQPQTDSFAFTHRSLLQCIVEVHQRAKALYPQRKACKCSITVTAPCPPSHFWAPPPNIPQTAPVLPDLYSGMMQRGGVLQSYGNAVGVPPEAPLSPASKLAVVDTLNFELGALNSSSDQNWMSFF